MTEQPTSPQGDPHDLLAGFVLDAFDPDESRRFTAHLPTCSACRTELAVLSQTAADLGTSIRVTPPPALEERLMESLFNDGEAVAAPASVPIDTRTRPRWLWPAAAAATFVLGAGLVTTTNIINRSDSTPQVVAEAQQIVDLAGASDAHFMPLELETGTVNLIVSDEMNMGAVMATDLPMPQAGLEYHVWTIMEDGSMEPAVSFLPDSSGHASVMLDTGIRDSAGFMLTVDPAGAEHPSGPALAEVQT